MRTRPAFTLFEVMITLGIVLVLAGAIMGFFWNLLDGRAAIAGAAARQQGAAALFERIEADLACGVAGDRKAGAGISGNASRLSVLTRAVWMPEGKRSAATMGDLQGAEYAFDRGAGVVRARRWAAPDQEAAEAEVICDGVELLRFRYYDGQVWSARFDSLERGGLPVAIEVGLWYGTPQPEPEGGPRGPEERLPERDPDRVRLVIVPDGPVEAWKELR